MSSTQNATHTHCTVRWENTTEYAVVHLERAKTAVATLKVGIVITFEGYQRVRRRGEILFLGSKKDCISFGFGLVDFDELQVYGWGDPPGLREQADNIVQTIQGGNPSSFQRTASSSSTTSTNNLSTKPKRKKLNDAQSKDVSKSTTVDDRSMAPPLAPLSSVTPQVASSNGQDIVNGQSTSDSSTSSNQQTNSKDLSTIDVDSLLKENVSLKQENLCLKEENKSIREKILTLEDELVYQRETSVPLPGEETCNYYRSVLSLYDKTKNEHNVKSIELAKKLPCSSMELKLAKKQNEAATINNLVKCCFKDIKDVDLKIMPYKVIHDKYPELLDNIYGAENLLLKVESYSYRLHLVYLEYVQYIHAPLVITKSRFSSVISLKSRHIRDGDKRKASSEESSGKIKLNKKQNVANKNREEENEEHSRKPKDLVEVASDKENSIDAF